MRVVAARVGAQRRPGFDGHLTVGFRCQRQNDFGSVNRRFNARTPDGRAVQLGVVQLFKQIHFAVGVPVDPFTAITQFFEQRSYGSEALIGVRIITLDNHQVRSSAARNQVTLAFFPVFHTERLRQFCDGIVLDWQRDEVSFHAEMADADAGELFGDAFVDFPVAFGIPCRINGGGQRMNKRMHIRRIHVVFFIPGCGRQNDVGIQTGAGHTEIKRYHQIQFAFAALRLPFDFLRHHAALHA